MAIVGTIAVITIYHLLPDSDYDGVYYEKNNNVTVINNPVPMKYTFEFSKNQILEADLVAFRFMENLGCHEEYLNGLKILRPVYTERYAQDPIDPSITTSHINFIEFMQEYPGLGLE